MSAEQLYSSREERFRAEAGVTERRSRSISRARLAVFLLGAAALIAAINVESSRLLLLGAVGLTAVVFLTLVSHHQRVEDRLEHERALADVNRHALARVRRNWRDIPVVRTAPPPVNHPFASDLDVLGEASLLQLLGSVGTADGVERLRSWLVAPAEPSTIMERQAAVADLAGALDARQELLARALQAARGRGGEHDAGLARFFEWAEDSPWFASRWWLVWLTRLLAGATVGLALLQAAGIVRDPVWLGPMLLNVVLWFGLARRIEHTFNQAFARNSAPGREARMFEVVERQRFTADLLHRLQHRIGGASGAMRRLQRLMELADIRYTTLVHFPLNALTLWDFHVLTAVERWQMACGRHARDWFHAVGEVEALSALSGLKHDNPEWAFPSITEQPIFEAKALGHPLLPGSSRVVNDVEVGGPGTFLFVTGSNMSGKSTLLRAIGINAVLAQAGGPVCAASLRMPRAVVATSMRVQDSLQEGVSYFLAALQRLKQILERAASITPDQGVLLYLLDEILQGTNTAERQIAVRTILTQLLGTPSAIGAVTSHDLNLADEEPLASAAVPVHFEEHFDGDTMTFDYRLRPGVATSRNALKLMKMMGLAAAP